VWGAWAIADGGVLDAKNLKACWHAPWSNDATFEVAGGSGVWESCSVRSIGGVVVECTLEANLTLSRCSVGGLNSENRRAQEGLIACMKSRVAMSSCTVEMCGAISGFGVQALDESVVVAEACSIRLNAVGLVVASRADVVLRGELTLASHP